MSISLLLDPLPKPWANLKINNLDANIVTANSLVGPTAVTMVGDVNGLSNANTINNYITSKYMVGAINEPYTLIQAAINQAVIDGASGSNPKTVLITPGTYTENITLQPFVHLVGLTSLGVYIDGTLDGNISGSVQLQNILVTNATTSAFKTTGLNGGSYVINNCTFQMTGANVTPIVDLQNPNTSIQCDNCQFTGNVGTNVINCNGGFVIIKNSFSSDRCNTNVSGNSNFILQASLWFTTFTVNGAAANCSAFDCVIVTQSSPTAPITVLTNSTFNLFNTAVQNDGVSNIVNGDGTGFFNRAGCFSINGITTIAGVTASSFLSI